MDDLGARRTRRWWQTGRPIRSIGRAGAFIDDVGFALLFPIAGVALPSLYEAASEQPVPLSELAWGPDAQRGWGWKDELPRKGLAWSGRLLAGGRASFLAPELLADCYPRAGEPDDFRQAPLGAEARRVAETLLASSPLPTAVLRQAVGLEGGRVRPGQAVLVNRASSRPPWSTCSPSGGLGLNHSLLLGAVADRARDAPLRLRGAAAGSGLGRGPATGPPARGV